MSNILKIIASDIKRLSTNVVAIVVIIGLSVIPCLYAWFNILSNWDPYGPDATKNLQVAVYSCDQGMTIAGKEINVGDIVVTNLKQNTSIGWVFTESDTEAINGVYAGDYYAALVIEDHFTDDMVSFLGGNIENPKITYYENEKKNAIAPKITNKVKNTVQQEIDEAFISTIAETLFGASDSIISADQEGNISSAAIARLETLDSDVKGVILILDSYIALMDSNESLMTASAAVSDQIDSLIESASAMTDSAQTAATSMETIVNSSGALVNTSLGNINSGLDGVSNMLSNIFDSVSDATKIVNIVDGYVEEDAVNSFKEWNKKKQEFEQNHSDIIDEGVENGINDVDDAYKKLVGEKVYSGESEVILDGDLYQLRVASIEGAEDVDYLSKIVQNDIKNCQSSINSIISEYNSTMAPQFRSTNSQVGSSLKEVERLLKYRTSSIDSVIATLGTYPVMLDGSKEKLIEAREEAVDMENKLSTIIDKLKDLSENEQYAKVMELLADDPVELAEFIASPVKLAEEYVYPIENNGSAASPFYIVLSIWVGALIMSTILKTTVKNKDEFPGVKNWECFVGRYFVTFVIGQIQTLITVLGALLYVDIQCQHPFLMWLACSWTSTVFSLLLYSFTYSFGNVGEALSVILMVIQVAGAGGTFPIEVLPKVFQYLYKFMPFNYAMNALRECVGGFYNHSYWIYLLTLCIFVVIAIINGVLLYYPCVRLNEQIEKSKEKSGILI